MDDINEFIPENEDDEEYESEMVTLTDEEGNEIEMELLDIIEHDGDSYAVMLPPESDEVVIMQIESLNDEEDSFSPVADDDMLTAIYEEFKERNADYYDFE